MPAFLVITSLSLAFYLGLLAVLHRDGRKRRVSGGSAFKVRAGSVAELGPLPTTVYAAPSHRRQKAATVLVRLAVNSGRGKLKSQVVQSEPAKVVSLPAPARNHDDAQFG